MSSKATKNAKRVSSGGKHRDRKGGTVNTPETSTHGTASVCSEGTGQEKPHESGIDDVLRGEDVYALSIREEELSKIYPPKLPSVRSTHTKRVFVRRNQPKEASTKHKRVAVLHPLPPGTAVSEVKPLSTVEATPRFTKDGAVISHSLLGSSRDFAADLKDRDLVGSTSKLTKPPPVVLPKVTKVPRVRRMAYEKTIVPREKNALEHWDRSMELRKSQQQSLCDKLGSSPEELAMNKGDGFRKVQEERMLIERAMPSVNYGKGYRVGSEFWSQQVRLGNETTGINITLTRTERGLPPELEFVGVPTMVRQQKGEVERNVPLHYTWKQSPYLSTRTEELGDIINDVQPFRPDTSALQVVGHAPGNSDHQEVEGEQTFSPEHTSRMRLRTDSLDSLGESDSLSPSPSDEEDTQGLLDFQPDSTFQPIIGPALKVEGHLLKWEGPPPKQPPKNSSQAMHSRAVKSEITLTGGRTEIELEKKTSTASLKDFTQEQKKAVDFERRQKPLELRVTFENNTQEMSTSHLEMENCGTAAVYYSWQPVPKPNPLGTVQAGDTQRFYFDTRGGVLQPNQKLAFPFVFKSPNAGIFTEAWSLHTGPVLCRGRPVILTLKGVAFQEDINREKREELERLLSHRMAVAAAESIVNRLAATIRTPPHSPEPFETTLLEEDIFREKNPDVHYRYNVIQQLKRLYDSILRPELVQDETLAPEPSTKSEKGVTGKKGEEKSAGGKKSGKEKEKKGAKPKEEPVKETPTEPAPVISQVPDWDLSIESLQEVIMSVEESESREEKLKLLSSLVGELSFPPPALPCRQLYNIGYQALCEAIDHMTEVSTRLRVVMGLPVKELQCASGVEQEEVPSQPSSPALPSTGKGKRGAKDTKKSDPKQKVVAASKDKERAGSSKIKATKSKTTASPKGQQQTPSETPSTAVTSAAEVDPILEKKYKENLYTAVYEIIGSAVESMSVMFEELV